MPVFNDTLCPCSDPSRTYFSDEFAGADYENRIWAVTGTGSATIISTIGGLIRIRGNAGQAYRFNHGNDGAFSVAQSASVFWRASLQPATAGVGGYTCCGLYGATNPTTSGMCWQSIPGNTNFTCEVKNAGTATNVNSGIARDTNYHDFKIECFTGSVLFYLDGVLITTVTTNITTELLQPTVRAVGSSTTTSDVFAEFVEVWGVRV